MGFIDIEAEDLKADYGIMFSYVIKPLDQSKLYFDILNRKDVKNRDRHRATEDKRILLHLIKDMRNFDRLVGHYSSRYDLPFIRTRAVICGLDFPEYGVYVQSDNWMTLRCKFKLSRNSLENASRKLLGKTEKTHLSLEIKHAMLRGEKWAQDYTLDHNIRDVRDTERIWKVIHKFVRPTQTSI